jgi:hypothetical protein
MKSEAGNGAAVGAAVGATTPGATTSGASTAVCSELVGVDAVAVDPWEVSSDEQPAPMAVRASAATAAATCRAIWVTGSPWFGRFYVGVWPESDRSRNAPLLTHCDVAESGAPAAGHE